MTTLNDFREFLVKKYNVVHGSKIDDSQFILEVENEYFVNDSVIRDLLNVSKYYDLQAISKGKILIKLVFDRNDLVELVAKKLNKII